MTYYYVKTDDNGVLLVERFGDPEYATDVDNDVQVAALLYREVIYFEHEAESATPSTEAPVEWADLEDLRRQMEEQIDQLRQHMDEQVDLLRSEIDDID